MEYRRAFVAVDDAPRTPRCVRRPTFDRDSHDDDDNDDKNDEDVTNNNNNNNNNSNSNNTSYHSVRLNSTTALVDELEQLRTENFQLRLRVYNAERRVDGLLTAARPRRRKNACGDSDEETGSSGSIDTTSAGTTDDDDDDDGETEAAADAREVAAAKATAGAAVRTIHDLLTVNRRLLALLATTVSAKAVAVTANDKRRWRLLRDRIDDCAGGQQENELENDLGGYRDSDNESESNTSADSEACSTARMTVPTAADQAETPLVRFSPPPPLPEPDRGEPASADNDDGDEGGELVRLRARCRQLQRSLQQLVNTELWARNRQIGKLEQHRYVTTQMAAQSERRSAASQVAQLPRPATTAEPISTTAALPIKGILVSKSPPESPPAPAVATATPPPVLPDYSEVNFFYSCDEEEDEEENDDDGREEEEEEGSETDVPSSPRSTPAATCAARKSAPPTATSTPVRARKRHCRRHHRPPQQSPTKPGATAAAAAAGSSSTESVMEGVLSSRSETASPTMTRRRLQRWRRRRYSTCGRCGGGGDDEDRKPPPAVAAAVRNGTADAEVQCDGGDGDDEQLTSLHRELEARRRENCRLYDMLLRLRRDGENDAASPADSDRDDDGSPEPYRRAARAVRGRIADLLPPLLSSGPVDRPPADDGGPTLLRQQQRQLQLLARLRERIVAYERHELQLGGADQTAAAAAGPEDAVEHMDRAALVNVALPRAVDRLRRALVPLLRHRSTVVPEEPDPGPSA